MLWCSFLVLSLSTSITIDVLQVAVSSRAQCYLSSSFQIWNYSWMPVVLCLDHCVQLQWRVLFMQITVWAAATWSLDQEGMGACPATLRLGLESVVPRAAAHLERLGGTPVRPVPLSTAVRKCPRALLVLPCFRRDGKSVYSLLPCCCTFVIRDNFAATVRGTEGCRGVDLSITDLALSLVCLTWCLFSQ